MTEVDLIIADGSVVTMDDQMNRYESGAIAIQGDTIVSVGHRDDVVSHFTARRIIDAGNHLVIPGLVNCHTHAAMTCFRGIADDLKLDEWLNNYIFPAESKNVDQELVYWGSLLACAEMICSGTTTFFDMYIFEAETARAACEAGMRCLLGEVLFDFPSPSSPTPDDGLAYTRSLLDQWSGDPLVSIAVEPHALYTCSRDLLTKAKSLADDYNAPVAVHLLETAFERQQLEEKLGCSATKFLDDIGYLDERLIAFHCVAMDDDDIRRFADNRCAIVHNPESNMKLASGVAPVPDFLSAGITVGLGTDGAASNNNLDMLQEMDMAAKLHKVHRLDPTVMDAETVVRMATCEGARCLGMDREIGSLESGKKADIVLIDCDAPHMTPMYNEYSHLTYVANGADVDTVIINGCVVMEERVFTTINVKDAMKHVRTIARRISQSLEHTRP